MQGELLLTTVPEGQSFEGLRSGNLLILEGITSPESLCPSFCCMVVRLVGQSGAFFFSYAMVLEPLAPKICICSHQQDALEL